MSRSSSVVGIRLLLDLILRNKDEFQCWDIRKLKGNETTPSLSTRLYRLYFHWYLRFLKIEISMRNMSRSSLAVQVLSCWYLAFTGFDFTQTKKNFNIEITTPPPKKKRLNGEKRSCTFPGRLLPEWFRFKWRWKPNEPFSFIRASTFSTDSIQRERRSATFSILIFLTWSGPEVFV